MSAEIPTPEPLPVHGPGGEPFIVRASPSGVIGWHYDSGMPEGTPVAIAMVLFNVLGRLVFRFGWSLVVLDAHHHTLGRRRFRSKGEAVAHLPGLAAALADSGRDALR